MTYLEQEIWDRWTILKSSTAKIAKALDMEEHLIDRKLHEIKEGMRDGR